MKLFCFSMAWLAGIGIGRVVSINPAQWLILGGCSLLALLAFRRNPIPHLIFMTTLFFSFGGLRYVTSIPKIDSSHIASYNDRGNLETFEGIITASPDLRDAYTGLKIETLCHLEPESGNPRPLRGKILAYASPFNEYQYGDKVRVTGLLETPPEFETFSYREYLARQGIHSLMQDPEIIVIENHAGNPLLQAVYGFRARALEIVQKLFPDPEASLLAGILLGIESGIAPKVRKAFDATGTTHIIAISGFNITIISALFISLFGRWLGVRRGAVAAGLAIAVYTVLVGADAAVVRAAVMGGIVLLANRIGRQTHGMASLGGAAFMMSVIHPNVLCDVGFQLSFAATLGLILYAETLQDWFVRTASRWLGDGLPERLAEPVGEYILFTLAAQVTTLPLIAYYFRRISIASFLANPVILPVQPAVMILAGLSTLAGCLWLPLGTVLAWSAWPFAAFTIRVVDYFATWHSASVPLGPVPIVMVAFFYLALFGITALLRTSTEQHPRLQRIRIWAASLRLSSTLLLSVLAVLAALTWRAVVNRPDGRLHLTILDAGGGDAILIETPTGRYVLVDGGSSTMRLSTALGRRLPPLAAHLDWIVIGGTHEEQIAGLAGAIERFSIGSVLIAGDPNGPAYSKILDAFLEKGINVQPAIPKQKLDLGSGATLEVVAVSQHGAILLLKYEWASFLLTPGADPEMVRELEQNRSFTTLTGLMLADSGYHAVNPPTFLASLRPWLVLVSVEAGNKRGLPDPRVLEALQGTTVLRTDRHGWIHCASDGKRLWVEVERTLE
jgi:competence protein ComEC